MGKLLPSVSINLYKTKIVGTRGSTVYIMYIASMWMANQAYQYVNLQANK
jgi:hypothetical protein